ncbi:MAG: arylsulfatase [Rhodospirillales bacterium]|nr:arylsulfatase [Rhodospirillales bacterium]
MSRASPRISLVHATPVAVEPVVGAFRRLWPEADVYNLLEDSLAPDLDRAGALDDAMTDRFMRLGRYAADCGADGILFTCSAFGACIEAVADALKPMPVLKPNEAMFAEALDAGTKVGMLATFQPSVPSMEREFKEMAAAAGSSAELTAVFVPGAMQALLSGDAVTHNALIADAVDGLGEVDVLLLAQFSMAQARDQVQAKTSAPILTSPESAVRALQVALV